MNRQYWVEAETAAGDVRPGGRVYVSGCLGEPTAILDAVERNSRLWREVRLTGALIPGVNTRDYCALGENTTVETIFALSAPGKSGPRGTVAILPFHYSSFWQWLSRPGGVDVAFFQVTPPRADGTVGLGPSVDFVPAVLESGCRAYGVVNRHLPDAVNGVRIPLERLRGLVAGDRKLPAYGPGRGDAATRRIAERICSLLPEACTLQLGLGRAQGAVLEALGARTSLGFHGGMISQAMLPALDAGIFSRGVVTGVALGNADFIAAAARRSDIAFRPVRDTHGIDALAAVDRFVAVNSVLSVDLFGQANVEMMGHRQVSGHGGLVDFMRGAMRSPGGRSVLAIPATARNGTLSRIVPELSSPVSVARSDVDMVVSEYGVAELRDAGVEDRAERLIAIAAPAFREGLADAWKRMQQDGEGRNR